MNYDPNLEMIPEETEHALNKLAWAIEASQGKFKLFLARCNYTQWSERLTNRLQQLCSVPIRRITLKESDLKLHGRIRVELGDEEPQAVIVFGLETVTDIHTLLSSANQVREEFQKQFNFPLVLWINDEVFTTMMRVAPDFESWAIALELMMPKEAIVKWMKETAHNWFTTQLTLTYKSALKLQGELEAAQQDLTQGIEELEPNIAANLESLFGRVKFVQRQPQAALVHYQKAADLWQELNRSECLGKIYHQIALCYYVMSREKQEVSPSNSESMREAIAHCLDCLKQTDSYPQFIANFLDSLGLMLRQLQDWETLETIVNQAFALHKWQNKPLEIARDYGFLAEICLAHKNWNKAKNLAEKSLYILEKLGLNITANTCLYNFILGQAQAKLNEIESATYHLKRAKEIGNPDDDTQLYLDILFQLQNLYFQQHQYLEAFNIKLCRQSIEQQYGLRAFVGACRIQGKRQENFGLSQLEVRETIAPEIAASGRMLDIEKIIVRIGRPDYKMTIIHGQSGVGKSSLVNGGLIPALKQKTIGYHDGLPITLRVYTDWVSEFGKSLAEALAEKGVEMPAIAADDIDGKLLFFLEQLQETETRNLRVVLIFDQFEEFFFVCTTPGERRQFFKFLGNCLNILSLKVILSLREDYLHYLLECEPLESMRIIGNDILSAKTRYSVGNFSPQDAHQIIQRLTEKSQVCLTEELITELVRELACELNAVRPIELQVVGAQLQAEQITTLAQYRQWGPKAEFVKRYLAAVVADCGPENQQAGALVLYLLTDEKGTRPLKTRDELDRDLHALAAELTEECSQLDLVLKIFVKSGLVLLVPEKPNQRYQLVHDYLAEFIRHHQQPHLDRLMGELEKERGKRLVAEKESRHIALVLKKAIQILTILELANHRIQKRIRCISRVIFVASLIAAIITGGWAVKMQERSNEMQERSKERAQGIQLAGQGFRSLRQFQQSPIDGLVSAMQTGEELKVLVNDQRPISKYPATRPMLILQTLLDTISEQNQLPHEDQVESANFSPDGKYIVTASKDKTARVWDASSGKLGAELRGHQDVVYSASFSPDGKYIVTASWDKTARVWDLLGNRVAELTGHQGAVYSASFSPDGKYIVTASWDKTARVWDASSGNQLRELRGHQDWVHTASFSPDGKYIVTASKDKTARVWDASSGKRRAKLWGHQAQVESASFSPDGKHIVTASWDKTARVWDLSGNQLAKLTGHQDLVYSASFSPDGKHIVTASWDKTARVWDLSGNQLAKLTGHQDVVYSASFSPDGKYIVTTSWDKTARVWDLSGNERRELTGHQGYVYSASFSPDGQQILTASYDKTARVWSLNSQKKSWKELTGHRGVVRSGSFSSDGKYIVTTSEDNTARVWDASSGNQLRELIGHGGVVNSASFSPDGKQIVTASADKTARVWDTSSGNQLRELRGHTGGIESASFSPDGKYIVTASADKTARLWDVSSGNQLKELTGHTGAVESASFSLDGKHIVTASADKTAQLWDVSSGSSQKEYRHQEWVNSASFSPDGKYIVTASDDKIARVWDLSGNELAVINHPDWVYRANFSPDGKQIVTASRDNTARVWDLEWVPSDNQKDLAEYSWLYNYIRLDEERRNTSSEDKTASEWEQLLSVKQVGSFTGHQDILWDASFSPDGKHIVTASGDNTARVWRVGSLDELLLWGCDWLGDYLVTHPRELDKLETCQTPSNLAEAAPFLVKEGEAQAREGQVDAAVETFRKALKWNAGLDFDPEARAKQLAEEGNQD